MIQFITVFALSLLIQLYLYTKLFECTFYQYFDKKDFLANETPSPKIIVDCGSNGHFGINSKILEEELGLPVVNLSDMAGVPLSHKLDRLKSIGNEDDIIILPLEYHYYKENKYDINYINKFSKRYSSYFKYLTLQNKIDLIVNIRGTLIFEYYLEKIILNNKKDISDPNKPIIDYFFSANDISLHGDFIDHKSEYGLIGTQDVNEILTGNLERIDIIEDIKKFYIKYNNLFITWPSLTTKNIQEISATSHSRLNKLVHELKAFGLKSLGSPQDFIFARDLYGYDTPYHLNEKGANLRTKLIAKLLKDNIYLINFGKASTGNYFINRFANSNNSYVINPFLNTKHSFSSFVNDIDLKIILDNKKRSYLSEGFRLEIGSSESHKSFIFLAEGLSNYQLKVLSNDENRINPRKLSDFAYYFENECKHFFLDIKYTPVIVQNSLPSSFELIPLNNTLDQVNYVIDLYDKYLNRTPDISGFLGWLRYYDLNNDKFVLEEKFREGAQLEISNSNN
jgi:hypothetical protein